MPKCSIILPCYNVEKYIGKSIQSVLNQTYTDFELLVIIDGSPDNSKSVAESYIDSRITVYEKENGGLSDARNYGLERAKGEFVYFMDSDDHIDPNLLEDNLKIIEEEKLNIVIFGYTQENQDRFGNVVSSTPFLPAMEKLVRGNPDLKIDSHHIGLMGYAWNKIYRKSFLDQHQFRFQKGISLVEDILFNAPLYAALNEIRFNKRSYYHYFVRAEPTLMKKFYADCYNLKVLKNEALEIFLKAWKVKDFELLLSEMLIAGIRYTVNNLYENTADVSSQKRRHILHEITSSDRYCYLLPYYRPKSLKDKIFMTALKSDNEKLMSLIKKMK